MDMLKIQGDVSVLQKGRVVKVWLEIINVVVDGFFAERRDPP